MFCVFYHRYPKLYGRLDRVTFDRHITAKLQGFVWGKNDSFFNLKIRTDCQQKKPYLNSSVCLLVFSVVSAAIESDSVEF